MPSRAPATSPISLAAVRAPQPGSASSCGASRRTRVSISCSSRFTWRISSRQRPTSSRAIRTCETSKTGTVRKKMRFSPVSSPSSSRCLTATGARIFDRLLALADATVEREEGAEPGDVRGDDAAGVRLDRNQPLVAEAVPREAVGRADLDPALPALACKQGARGLLDAFAVGLAARGGLIVGERATVEPTGHRWAPLGWV